MKKDEHKKEGKQDRAKMMGRPKLTIKTSNLDVSVSHVDLYSYTYHTSSTVYLPWLPVIIINMSFSLRRPFTAPQCDHRITDMGMKTGGEVEEENWQLRAVE